MRNRTCRARSASPKKSRNKLCVQSLEQRSLLAADIGLTDGYVQIHGTEHNDVAEVFQQDDQLIVNYQQFGAAGNLMDQSQHSFVREQVGQRHAVHAVQRVRGGAALYYDHNHLSRAGSSEIISLFEPIFSAPE